MTGVLQMTGAAGCGCPNDREPGDIPHDFEEELPPGPARRWLRRVSSRLSAKGKSFVAASSLNAFLSRLRLPQHPLHSCDRCLMIARYLSTLRDTPPWIIKLDSSYVANTCQFCTMLSSLTVDGTKPTSPPRFLLSLCNERISRADSFICEISSYRDQGQLYLMGERSDIRVLRARPRVDVDDVEQMDGDLRGRT